MVTGVLPAQMVHTSDGFGPIQLGGVLNVRFADIAYSDTTAKKLFTLPKGAEIVAWQVNVKTAFNDSGTDLLDIGDGVSANHFADNLNVSAVGQSQTGFDADELAVPLTAETAVQATFTGQNTDASAGSATIFCFFILR